MNDDRLGYSTAELAKILGRSPGTLRTRLCRFGHFHGVKPKRLVSGQLVWPLNAVEQLTREVSE